jgi:BirA family biotin operon repressor/biotin-[acetyl-CoA-carboxylase] ligase
MLSDEVSDWHKQLQAFVSPNTFLCCVESVPSTMTLARELIAQHKELTLDSVGLVVARQQSAGRGRLNRSWESYQGNLLTTIILPYNQELSRLNGFSLVVGCAVALFLREWGVAVRLKWPNDILDQQGRKLGGILIETLPVSGLQTGISQFILTGIGVNLCVAPQGASHLEMLGLEKDHLIVTSPAACLARFLPYLLSAFNQFIYEGFAAFKRSWLEFADIEGREIQFSYQGEKRLGTFVNLTEQGILQVLYEGKLLDVD